MIICNSLNQLYADEHCMNHNANCWPDEKQMLLLKAALCEYDTAQSAWHAYCARTDLHNINHAETTLLPLVFYNLKHDHRYPDQFQLCKSVHQHTWASNHLALFQFKKLSDAFADANIAICFLKGAALILNDYPNAGLRVMGDIDILVSKEDVKNATALLKKLRHDPKSLMQQTDIDELHAQLFYSESVLPVDLHWKIFIGSGFDNKFSNFTYQEKTLGTNKFNLNGKTLSAEDQLLHVLVHGLQYNQTPLIRWITDSHFILKNNVDFDWVYFLAQTKNIEVMLLVKKAILFLQAHQFSSISNNVLTLLNEYTPRQDEIRYLKFITTSPSTHFMFPYKFIWSYHVRNLKTKNRLIAFFMLPAFLKNAWGIKNWFLFFIFLFKKIKNNLRKACTTNAREA